MTDLHGTEAQSPGVPKPRPQDEFTRRDLLKRASPLGNVDLDASRCTGCGICASECPNGSLVIVSTGETDIFQLLFKHGLCDACGRCADICPEKCLSVERTLDLGRIASQSVLFEDRLVRCAGCGAPVGPKPMIDKLRARMAVVGRPPLPELDLCPGCKIGAQPRMVEV